MLFTAKAGHKWEKRQVLQFFERERASKRMKNRFSTCLLFILTN